MIRFKRLSRRSWQILGFLFILLCLLLGFWLKRRLSVPSATPPAASPTQVSKENFCDHPIYPREDHVMEDYALKGLIEQGQHYTVLKDWYRCNPVERGDIVFYRYHSSFPPVPRRVVGVSGDRFKLVPYPKRQAWSVAVNGEVVKMAPVTPGGEVEPRYFGSVTIPPVLSLYEKSMKGVLKDCSLIFTTTVPSHFDSESGPVGTADFLGKIELPTASQTPDKKDSDHANSPER
jgi:hypothetical protein